MSKKDEDILEACQILIDETIKKLKFNRYIQVQVSVVHGGNLYDVKYKGQIMSNVKGRVGSTFSVNDVCYVCIPNNEDSFPFIDCLVP